jgi:protein-tyrosine phosphatase
MKEVVRADAIICCAKEITDDVTILSNSEFAKSLSGGVSLIPMIEADLTTDSYTSTLEAQLREAAAIIHSHVSLGRKIVVACKYGYNRSASSVLSYLVLYKETSLIIGLETLRKARPKVYPNIETWPSLLRIEESSCLNNNSSTLGSGRITMEEILTYHAWSPRSKRLH